jgi:pimeloyl-ACP methyl ester carboxylesterase
MSVHNHRGGDTPASRPGTGREAADLAGIAADALRIQPPDYIASIFGKPATWLGPHHPYSELRLLDLWRPLRALTYLANVALPTIPLPPPTFGPPLVNSMFWRPSVILQRPDHNGSSTSFPDEAWFFLNGIMTNDAVAQLNAAYLAYLFHRPISLIQNTTCGLLADLLECAVGKQWRRTTEAVVQTLPPIYDALKSQRRRVVVIAHSQGTIIAALALQFLAALTTKRATRAESAALGGGLNPDQPFAGPVFVYPDQAPLKLEDFEPLTEDELAKLELYMFANCATGCAYYRRPTLRSAPVPWIESFGNELDIVARLGMLAPDAAARGVVVEGPRYVREGAWGHLLNEHYLRPIEEQQKSGRKRGGSGGCAPFAMVDHERFPDETVPRLYSYINGGSPA